ncbi:hypothetical protein L1887_42047 [Cichorium endivia]|nr:hypothetical protein L1887_42047 [Cichorium endivia]
MWRMQAGNAKLRCERNSKSAPLDDALVLAPSRRADGHASMTARMAGQLTIRLLTNCYASPTTILLLQNLGFRKCQPDVGKDPWLHAVPHAILLSSASADITITMASAEPTSSTPSTSSITLDATVPTPSGDHDTPSTTSARADSIVLEPYDGEHQMADIIDLIENELSEPYIVHTYRYFVNQWPQLCFLAYAPQDSAAGARLAVGVVVCKLDRHLKGARLMRGYIAMISVRNTWRGQGLAKRLVRHAVQHMVDSGAQEVVLETEADNVAALALYEGLGFIREKRLHRFYLNGKHLLPVPRLRLCKIDEAFKPNDHRQRLVPTRAARSTTHAEASTATHRRATSDGTGSTTIFRHLPCSAATAITATYARHIHHTADSRPHHLIPSNCIAVLSRAITAYKRRHLCVGESPSLQAGQVQRESRALDGRPVTVALHVRLVDQPRTEPSLCSAGNVTVVPLRCSRVRGRFGSGFIVSMLRAVSGERASSTSAPSSCLSLCILRPATICVLVGDPCMDTCPVSSRRLSESVGLRSMSAVATRTSFGRVLEEESDALRALPSADRNPTDAERDSPRAAGGNNVGLSAVHARLGRVTVASLVIVIVGDRLGRLDSAVKLLETELSLEDSEAKDRLAGDVCNGGVSPMNRADVRPASIRRGDRGILMRRGEICESANHGPAIVSSTSGDSARNSLIFPSSHSDPQLSADSGPVLPCKARAREAHGEVANVEGVSAWLHHSVVEDCDESGVDSAAIWGVPNRVCAPGRRVSMTSATLFVLSVMTDREAQQKMEGVRMDV